MKTNTYHMITLLLSIILISITNAQATDILAPPASLPFEANGSAWNQPLVEISGQGELKFNDITYEGFLTCTVSLAADAEFSNEIEMKSEHGGLEIETKSKFGMMDVSNCTIIDVSGTYNIAQSASMTGSKVELEIEGLYEDTNGDFVFSEYEAEAKNESGGEVKVKLELENGTLSIMTIVDTGDGNVDCADPANAGHVDCAPPEL